MKGHWHCYLSFRRIYYCCYRHLGAISTSAVEVSHKQRTASAVDRNKLKSRYWHAIRYPPYDSNTTPVTNKDLHIQFTRVRNAGLGTLPYSPCRSPSKPLLHQEVSIF